MASDTDYGRKSRTPTSSCSGTPSLALQPSKQASAPARGGNLHKDDGCFKGLPGKRTTSLTVSADGSGDAPSGAARRAAFRAGWDARLLPLLSAEWQSSATIAKALGEKPATVLERLRDMLDRQLVERRIVKAVPSKPTKSGKRPRIHTARFEAHFRLP
jgi:hypothetical protein